MRNRRKQRSLRRAGVRREEPIGPRNTKEFFDLTPREAVGRIVNERKEVVKCLIRKK